MIIKPDFIVERLYDIDFNQLKQQGINVIIFDLDSTIMASKAGCYTDEMKQFLCALSENFTLCVISNNKDKDYIKKVQTQSPFTVIGNGNKPSCKAMVCYLESINKPACECVVIGDRPLTDILAGKRLGACTILVDSITKDTEHKIVRFVRFLERLSVSRR